MGEVIDLCGPMRKLLEVTGNSMDERKKAAEILQDLASRGSYGSFPPELSMQEVGWALARICGINSNDANPLDELLKGWHAYMQKEVEPFKTDA